MLERETSRRKKIGNTELKMTVAVLRKLRDRISALQVMESNISIAKTCSLVFQDFPEVAIRSLKDYISSVDPQSTSDFLFGLCETGQISIHMFSQLAQGLLPKATKDALAHAVIEKHLPPSVVREVKQLLKKAKRSKKQMLLETAILTATGEISTHATPELVKATIKEFGGIVYDLNEAALKFMAKLDMCLDFMKDPQNILCTPENYLDVKEKVSTFKVTLKNSLSFVESTDARLQSNFKSQVIAEAAATQRRNEGGK